MTWNLKLSAPVSIEPTNKLIRRCWPILIMGPTGSGKSTFIEALAGEGQSLGISKDQLAGFTQEVTCYEMTSATIHWNNNCGYQGYIVDTPGFSDSKISEMEIITKVKTWMVDQELPYVHSILYLCPITDTRVSGSKRRTIKMLHALLPENSATRVTIITTMWDSVCSPQAKERAKAHFAQLRDDIWRELIDNGAQIQKFQNTHHSAIQIVSASVEKDYDHYPLGYHKVQHDNSSSPFLYKELVDRIKNAQQEKEFLRQEEFQLSINPDPLLESVVISRLQEVKMDLAKFLAQLVAFGRPPPEFEGVPEQFVRQSLTISVHEAREDVQLLQSALNALLITTSTNEDQESTLRVQLQEAEINLVEQSKRLEEYGSLFQGFSKALALESLEDKFKSRRFKFRSPVLLEDNSESRRILQDVLALISTTPSHTEDMHIPDKDLTPTAEPKGTFSSGTSFGNWFKHRFNE